MCHCVPASMESGAWQRPRSGTSLPTPDPARQRDWEPRAPRAHQHQQAATSLVKLHSGHFFDKLRNEPQIQGEKGRKASFKPLKDGTGGARMHVLQDRQVYPGVRGIWLMPRGVDLVQ